MAPDSSRLSTKGVYEAAREICSYLLFLQKAVVCLYLILLQQKVLVRCQFNLN